jgi:hypothetical protein
MRLAILYQELAEYAATANNMPQPNDSVNPSGEEAHGVQQAALLHGLQQAALLHTLGDQ